PPVMSTFIYSSPLLFSYLTPLFFNYEMREIREIKGLQKTVSLLFVQLKTGPDDLVTFVFSALADPQWRKTQSRLPFSRFSRIS
ncbi:MAG: hypothetical protein KJ726_05485, partial [Verrucomicrobia bacterium]|nr:hypothetical protein [Verrucomicrobiota bacterium]